jgi:hypothetical protein
MKRPHAPVTWLCRALVLTLTFAAATTALVAPANAASGAKKATFSYGCMNSLAACQQAGVEAGTSPEAVAQYLKTQEVSIASGYGHTINLQSNGRSYGWQLSRTTPGLRLNYYRCQVVNGVLTNCVYVGPIHVQARFTFNGHLVTNINGTFVNSSPVRLEVAHGMICRMPSIDCRSETQFGRSSVRPTESSRFTFVPQYLPGPEAYDMLFGWLVYDPEINSTAYTPGFDSLDFFCEQWVSQTNPGECFYQGQQG